MPKKLRLPPDPRPIKPRDVRKFTDHCVKLRSLWLHFHTVFEDTLLKTEMMQSIAPVFFGDLNELMIEQLILQICRLTDPEFMGRKFRNFTIEFLINNANRATSKDKQQLRRIASSIKRFRKKIEKARNKYIGHLDLTRAHRRRSMGSAPVAAWHQFWLDLQAFLVAMHRLYLPLAQNFI